MLNKKLNLLRSSLISIKLLLSQLKASLGGHLGISFLMGFKNK